MEVLEKITTLDGMIIIGFLLFNLLIGIYFSRGITSIKEYALGNRNFSTAAISYTIIATWIAGTDFPIVAYATYRDGIYYLFPVLADVLCLLIISYFYVPRMQEFLGKLSIAEAMGDMYGDTVKIFTAITGIMVALCRITVQFIFLNMILSYFFDIEGIYILALGYIIVISYSLFGGIKSVTFTDIIQFFTFGLVLPMTTYFIWQSFDNASAAVVHTLTTNPLFDYRGFLQFNNPKLLTTILLFLFFMIPAIDPVYFQRISMSRNTKQATKGFAIAALLLFICECIFIAFIGVLLISKNTPITEDNITLNVLDNYLGTGFKGCFIVGLIAMCVSTADSYINAISILSYDISKALKIRMSETAGLFYVRIIACVSGIIAITLSIIPSSLSSVINYSACFYMSIVSVPFILAIFGFRSTKKSILLGMLAGFTTALTHCFSVSDTGTTVMLGMLANLLTLVGSHYLLRQPGGWVGVKDDGTFADIQKQRRERIHNFFSGIQNFNIISYLKNSAKKQESIYVYLGFFCIISICFNLYSLPKNIIDSNSYLIDVIAYITFFLSTILISYPAWNKAFKNRLFISSVNHLSIFALVFISCLFTLMNHFELLQIIIFSVSLMMVAILLRWHMALFFIISAILIPFLFYKPSLDPIIPNFNINIEVSLAYISIMICLISIIFLKPKEDHLEILETKSTNLWQKVNDMDKEVRNSNNIKTEFLSNISHEVRTPITGITSLGKALWDNYDNLPDSKRRECVYTIAKNSERLISLMNNILDFSSLTSLQMELYLQKINLSDVVEESIKRCKKLYLEEKELRFEINIEKKIYVNCDVHHLTHTIDNLIINAICYSKPGTIVKISLKQEEGITKFAIRDEGIGIPVEELPIIFRPFTTSSKTRTPAGGRGIGLALCYAAITAHKGRIWAASDGASWAEFKFEI